MCSSWKVSTRWRILWPQIHRVLQLIRLLHIRMANSLARLPPCHSDPQTQVSLERHLPNWTSLPLLRGPCSGALAIPLSFCKVNWIGSPLHSHMVKPWPMIWLCLKTKLTRNLREKLVSTWQHTHPCNRNDPEDGGKESLEFKESLGCRWRRRLTKSQIRTQQEASHLQIKARPQKKATLPIPSLQSYQRTISCFSHHSIVGVFFWKPELLWYLLLSFKVSP